MLGTQERNYKNYPPYSFQILLLVLASLILVPAYIETQKYAFFFKLIFSVVLLSALYLVVHSKKEFIVGLVLAVPVVIYNWLPVEYSDHHRIYIQSLLNVGFLLYISFHLLRYLIAAREVSADMIYAAVCLYLLIGLIWAIIYYSVELHYPSSFDLPQSVVLVASESTGLSREFLYFSFVTITTLGYGDITPSSDIAQSWVIFEAIIGQFYLAVIVARLVSLQITSNVDKS